MSEVTLDELDPLRRNPSKKPDQNVVPMAPQATKLLGQSRGVSAALRAQIWRESDGRCAYVAADSGKRCDSTFGLEIEHCLPFALGGSSKDAGNLRLLCKQHNQLQAIETYGLGKMEKYLNSKSPVEKIVGELR